ncbi:Barwin-related endoglucanase [Corchorus capsularis]|uniref:Barwin-related endoglucanase n=1 Tax=Corchorus capsularis TaxID=210143 RepID=A0A1R3I848_COCAP|nr:Barwin-related endoglucanase [Corchorus capsularis]
MTKVFSIVFLLLCFLLIAEAGETCKPSGKIKGTKPPKGQCNQDHGSDCCKEGEYYNIYKCSPPVSGHTKAILTLNGFGPNDDGGGPSECDNQYHNDNDPIVALSTGWFNKKKRCHKYINIHGNGKSVKAKVVDECDSTMGCDKVHDDQPPCDNNIVDASKAVWEALGVPENDRDCFLVAEAGDTCKPSGKVKGKKPPGNQCNHENNSDCCQEGKYYNIYKCSPPVTSHTKATLTENSFEPGGDGGGPSECDNQYHNDNDPIVALSTGWFNNKKRCHKYINIHGNGKSVKAKVVDECDSTMGCDKVHAYQPPCDNNIVDASKAVWEALGIPKDDSRRECFLDVEARPNHTSTCKPSGKIKGKRPPNGCTKDSNCCKQGKLYDIYTCSPQVSNHTKATLTLNEFESNVDGGTPCECDGKFHLDKEHIVAISTGWYNKGSRCLNYINIHGNGKSVKAKVVDECDSTMGCDEEYNFQPPCANDVVAASKSVWAALGVPKDQRGKMEIQWSDA